MKSSKSYSVIFWLFVAAVVIYFGNEFYKSRSSKNEMFENVGEVMQGCPSVYSTLPKSGPFDAQPYDPSGQKSKVANLDANSGTESLFIPGNQKTADCFPKDKLTASDLLPQDTNNLWSQVVPNISNKNFLVGGANIGINSVGQVNRNPNLQIRSEPPNPQVVVSPWQQSTIGPDLARPALEIGCGPL